MATNRVQFQPGLSMAEFMARYGSDDNCEAALIESRWPKGFVCPSCGCRHSSAFRREGRLYFQCTACRHQCSVTSGTIFEATKLPLSRWFLAMHLLTQSKNNVAALELMRHLGVCYKTAWLMKHKLMEVMREREDSRQLEGRVEIDDAYLGGERTGGKVGRGSENKVPFVAAVQTTPQGNRNSCACASSRSPTKRWRSSRRARSRPRPPWSPMGCGASVPSRSSAPIMSAWLPAGGKASTATPQLRRVNTFLGNLKRSLGGTYHAFDSAKYAHRYLAEAQYRFNRRFDLRSILARLLRAACLTIPTPAFAIRAAEAGC